MLCAAQASASCEAHDAEAWAAFRGKETFERRRPLQYCMEKKSPKKIQKSRKIPKMGVRRALRARRTPIFGGFSGIFEFLLVDFFKILSGSLNFFFYTIL